MLIVALSLAPPIVSTFSFSPTAKSSAAFKFTKGSFRSGSSSGSTRHNRVQTQDRASAKSSSRLFMDMNDDSKNAFFVDPPGPGSVSTSADNDASASSSNTATVPEPKDTTDVSNLLAEARALKDRAEKERLEAERMTTLLILDKISSLEEQLAKVQSSDKDESKKQKRITEIQEQITLFRRQMEPSPSSTSKSASTSDSSFVKTIDASASGSSPLVTPQRNSAAAATTPTVIPERNMPQDLFDKRIDAFRKFTPEVKRLFARAVDIDDSNDAETIIRKCYNIEMKRKSDGNIAPMDLLDIANAQAGFETLPPPIQGMVVESVGMSPGRNLNNTAVVEKLVLQKKVKRTNDGGVEFSMEDSYEDNERSVRDREFTQEEVDSALGLYENLPAPMKAMLAKSVGEEVGSNSTVIVSKMIEEKKLLPAEDGVEFVVFGNGDESTEMLADMEAVNYVKSLLPEVMRKEGEAPSEEDAMTFFSEVLSKKNFNPTSKPESIPGGFIIRGDNTLKNGDELVKVLDAKLKESSVANKLNYYFMKDPSVVTQDKFEADDFELPVIVLTGPDISPDTNRFVKPIVTVLGGISIASFAVATCLSTDLNMDIDLVETMTAPLVCSMLGTQVAHEAAHQIVALKDKFKAGAPTIIPSLNLGLQGCITPIKTSPPNLNSLFDFAISGPLIGMLISVFLMYSGLEKQVFMDVAAQANLPSLPVDLVRSSSLAGGMVEWLLGDGTLISADGDPSALIRLHPLAIAGFIGIVSNALNLLPVGNTDGGRVAQALFGRTFSKFVRGVAIAMMILAGFFGGDEVNLLLFFAIFAQIWQKEPEIACKNEIDSVSDERAVLAFATAFLVGLAVVPLSL